MSNPAPDIQKRMRAMNLPVLGSGDFAGWCRDHDVAVGDKIQIIWSAARGFRHDGRFVPWKVYIQSDAARERKSCP